MLPAGAHPGAPIAHASPARFAPAKHAAPPSQLLSDILLAVILLQELESGGGEPGKPAHSGYPPAPSRGLAAWAASLAPRPPAPRSHRRTQVQPPPPPPGGEISRAITSATYTRRLFVTARLASLFRVPVTGDPPARMPVVLVDERDKPWSFTFERRGDGLTGSLVGSWTQFCHAHHVRVGDAVRFWRPADFPAATLGARVAVSCGAATDVAAAAAAAAAQESVARSVAA